MDKAHSEAKELLKKETSIKQKLQIDFILSVETKFSDKQKGAGLPRGRAHSNWWGRVATACNVVTLCHAINSALPSCFHPCWIFLNEVRNILWIWKRKGRDEFSSTFRENRSCSIRTVISSLPAEHLKTQLSHHTTSREARIQESCSHKWKKGVNFILPSGLHLRGG